METNQRNMMMIKSVKVEIKENSGEMLLTKHVGELNIEGHGTATLTMPSPICFILGMNGKSVRFDVGKVVKAAGVELIKILESDK